MSVPVRWCAAFVFAGMLLSCGGDSTPPEPDFTVSVGTMAATTLGTQKTFTVAMTSVGGFTGPVTIDVSGAPVSWTVAVNGGNTVNLVANNLVTATVTVTIPSNGAAATTGQTLTVDVTGDPGTKSGTTSLTVADEYVLPIAAGTGTTAGAHFTGIVGTTITLRLGTTLRIRNDDAERHTMHFSGGIPGFSHQADPGSGTGESYVAVSSGIGSDADVYCHAHGGGDFTVVVTN